MKFTKTLLAAGTLFLSFTTLAQPVIKIANGRLQGVVLPSQITIYRGIPFAKPPVGDLRWKEPQPADNWTGVRKADKFGPNAMQKNVFGDMMFRSSGMSEDCLYLNIWTPAKKADANLPVLVYFYGGGFVAGDGSESRYDGESMAQKGIVAVTVNYRLGVFGLLSHPELTKESARHASGNYGLLDQHAALEWVKKNIGAFGGNPNQVTIAGESAGSISVCDQMASPLSKGLFAGAIGESGGILKIPTLAEGEQRGLNFQKAADVSSLTELRAMPAEQVLEAASKNQGGFSMAIIVDGYFFPKQPAQIYKQGEQMHVPLLAGWNSAEIPFMALLGKNAPSPENYEKAVKQTYPNDFAEVLKLYPGKDTLEVMKSATELASDRFIAYSTWKWLDEAANTEGKPVYRYMFSRPRPEMVASMGDAKPGLAGGIIKGAGKEDAPAFKGASHASEIEYAMGNLDGNKVYAWMDDDRKVSATMENYFANFIKTGNPNGTGLTRWPAVKPGTDAIFINIDVTTKAEKEKTRARYLFLDKQNLK